MRYGEFVETVGQRAGIEQQRAEAASKAVIRALTEQVGAQRAHGLVDQLPQDLQPKVEASTVAPTRPVSEFYDRVSELEGRDPAEPDRHVQAVLATLDDATTGGQLREVVGQLPAEYQDLLPTGLGPVSGEAFLASVQQRGQLPSGHEAAAVTRIVFSTLAERISAGQARDLAAALPGELRPHLESSGGPRVFELEDLLERITHGQQVNREVAARYIRAVLRTLREHAPDQEIADTRAQLPSDFAQMFD